MARFERPRGPPKKESKGRSNSKEGFRGSRDSGSSGGRDRFRGNRESRGPDSFRGSRDPGRRDSFRGNRDSGNGFGDRRRETGTKLEMTRVTCSSCGQKCEVPFKPTSTKPVYCRECFENGGKGSSNDKLSSRDLDIINEKLNKIMKALDID